MAHLCTCSIVCGLHINKRPHCYLQNLKPTPSAEFSLSEHLSKHASNRNNAFSYALDRQEDKAKKLHDIQKGIINPLMKEQEQQKKALTPLKAGVQGLSTGLEAFKVMEKLVAAKISSRKAM